MALDAFAYHGYYETSMNDIAKAAGVTKPVLYQHFESKQVLYQALLDDVSARMLSTIVAGASQVSDGKTRTEMGFLAYFRWVHAEEAAFLLLLGSASRLDHFLIEAVRRVTSGIAAAIAPFIDTDIDDEHRMTLAYGIVGLAEGASRRLVDRGVPWNPDEVARRVSSLAWAGLRGVHR